MADRPPRHLAEPPRWFGLSHLQLVFLVALVVLALVTATLALLAGGAEPEAGRAAATTAPPAGATTTPPASGPSRPLRPTPGNLLDDADFERDLGGWTPLGGARLERVQGGASGRWAVAVGPGEPGAATPGMARPEVTTTEAGETYEASVWVRAGAPGAQVVLGLHEQVGERVAGTDVAGYSLPGTGWRHLAVEHRALRAGAALTMEITGSNLGGRPLLVDAVDVQLE
jgi:hypothetical protein